MRQFTDFLYLFPTCQVCVLCLAVLSSRIPSFTFRLSFTWMCIFMVFGNVALPLDGKPDPARCACPMLTYVLVGNIVKGYFLFVLKGVFAKLLRQHCGKAEELCETLEDHFLPLLKPNLKTAESCSRLSDREYRKCPSHLCR